MAKITNRFVHFKTKASFTSRLGAGDIQESSVVFIQDANEVWTHGTYYKCDISEAEVIALINSKGYITEADIPSLTGGASATSGQYVSGVTVSGHNVTVTKAALPTNAETATKLATPRVIAIAGAVSGSATFDGSSNISINSTLNGFDASKITSGTLNADRLPEIPISKIPAAAMERLYVVESQSAAMSLTIQEGDVVQIGSGGPMYFCVSESASTFATKFKVFTAGAATSVPWSGVTNAPTLSLRSLQINAVGYQVYSNVATSIPMIYAPTEIGTSGQILQSTGNGAPKWVNQSSLSFLPLSGGNLTGDLRIISNFTVDGETELNNNLWLGGDFVPSDSNQYSIGLELYKFKAAYINETYSTNFYMGDSKELVATQSWVTGRGYLTSIPAATSSAYGGIQIGYTTSGKNYAVQLSNGKAYVNVPWTDTNTDTKVTSVANHYTPSGGTTLSASGGSSLTAGSSQVVTGITKDAAGHVTGITSGSLPAAPTLSGLGGIGTVSASGTAPLTLSASKSGTSVTITGSVAAASSSSSGVVSTGTQTFAGEKTFSSEIQATGGISSKNIIHIDDGTYTGYLGNLDSIGLGSGDSFAVVSEGKLTLMTIDDSPIYFGQNEDCNITGSHFSGSAETANKVVGSLTIDGTAYNGSSNVTVNTKLLRGNNAGSIIKAGYSYSGCNSSITSISGFSYNNPDAVVASSTKITSFPSNVRKMANIANLSGTHYVYCFSYIGGYVYVNGAVYA